LRSSVGARFQAPEDHLGDVRHGDTWTEWIRELWIHGSRYHRTAHKDCFCTLWNPSKVMAQQKNQQQQQQHRQEQLGSIKAVAEASAAATLAAKAAVGVAAVAASRPSSQGWDFRVETFPCIHQGELVRPVGPLGRTPAQLPDIVHHDLGQSVRGDRQVLQSSPHASSTNSSRSRERPLAPVPEGNGRRRHPCKRPPRSPRLQGKSTAPGAVVSASAVTAGAGSLPLSSFRALVLAGCLCWAASQSRSQVASGPSTESWLA
jgi:hypothetical protein